MVAQTQGFPNGVDWWGDKQHNFGMHTKFSFRYDFGFPLKKKCIFNQSKKVGAIKLLCKHDRVTL